VAKSSYYALFYVLQEPLISHCYTPFIASVSSSKKNKTSLSTHDILQ